MKKSIVNGFLITANENFDVYENGCVYIDGSKIVYAGPQEGAPYFMSEDIIDAEGGIIMPGFYNTHTHLPMTLLRGYGEDQHLMDWLHNSIFPIEDRLTEEFCYYGTMLSLIEMVKCGTVAVNDMYMFMKSVSKAVLESGMKGLLCRPTMGNSMEEARERIEEAEAVFEYLKGQDKVRPAYCLYTEYTCAPELIEYIADRAKLKNARIHSHVSESVWEHQDCINRTGITPIAMFEKYGALDVPFMAAHCVQVTDNDIEIMSRKGVNVLSNPKSNLKLANGVAPIAKMAEMGVNVALGSDGAASNNNQSVMSEMQYAALLQKGIYKNSTLLKVPQAIRMATANGAKALGFDDSGVLKAGNAADIIIIDTSSDRFYPKKNMVTNLLYSAYPTDVCMTMVDGEILYEDGKVTFADEREILWKCEEIGGKLYG